MRAANNREVWRWTLQASAAVFIDPCLPTKVEDAPTGDDWGHEIKHDGHQIQLYVMCDGGLHTMSGYDWTDLYLNDLAADKGFASRV